MALEPLPLKSMGGICEFYRCNASPNLHGRVLHVASLIAGFCEFLQFRDGSVFTDTCPLSATVATPDSTRSSIFQILIGGGLAVNQEWSKKNSCHRLAICIGIVVIFISRSFITWLVILLTELLHRNEVPSRVLAIK